jgi:predicted RNA-binding protein
MCIASAYLVLQGETELIMENVESVQAVKTDVWDLSGLFGEDKRIAARIKRLELIDNQLFFEEVR